jgi:hypothetical protein
VPSAHLLGLGVDRATRTLFDPKQIPDLRGFWDATDRTTLFTTDAMSTQCANDGDRVGRWRDKSGNGLDWRQTQVSAPDYRPLFKLNQQNGRSGIRFSGSSGVSSTSFFTQVGTLSGASPLSWVVAMILDSDVASKTLLSGDVSSFSIRFRNDQKCNILRDSDVDLGKSSSAYSTGAPSVVSVTSNGGVSTVFMYKNGTVNGQPDLSTNSIFLNNTTHFGDYKSVGLAENFHGVVLMALCYGRALSLLERAALEAWVNSELRIF